MRILIVDDEKELGRTLKTLLACNIPNSQIDAVVNGAAAVNAFWNVRYDVVLLDIKMPVKDGYQTCLGMQEICSQENLKMPFVIFCSAYSLNEKMETLLADRSQFAFLRKPVTADQIRDAIQAVLK